MEKKENLGKCGCTVANPSYVKVNSQDFASTNKSSSSKYIVYRMNRSGNYENSRSYFSLNTRQHETPRKMTLSKDTSTTLQRFFSDVRFVSFHLVIHMSEFLMSVMGWFIPDLEHLSNNLIAFCLYLSPACVPPICNCH